MAATQCGISAVPTGPGLDRGIDGLRVGLLGEGFGIADASEPEVDEAVAETARALERLGATVRETSVPMHEHGVAIWSAIAVQGCADLVIRGDSVGTNTFGHTSPRLADFFARARREMADRFPPTLKVTLLSAEHIRQHAHHHYYATARGLARQLRGAYDAALGEHDVLVCRRRRCARSRVRRRTPRSRRPSQSRSATSTTWSSST